MQKRLHETVSPGLKNIGANQYRRPVKKDKPESEKASLIRCGRCLPAAATGKMQLHQSRRKGFVFF